MNMRLFEIQVDQGCFYPESIFLDNWTTCRRKILGKPTFIKKLNFYEKKEFEKIKLDYTREEINNCMRTLFNQERIPMDIMVLRPKHFLEKIDTYYSANGCKTIYGKKEGAA